MRPTVSVPKQILCASNIESIQTQVCFDLFFRKQIFIIVCIICPAKDDSLFVLGPKHGLLDFSYNKYALGLV